MKGVLPNVDPPVPDFLDPVIHDLRPQPRFDSGLLAAHPCVADRILFLLVTQAGPSHSNRRPLPAYSANAPIPALHFAQPSAHLLAAQIQLSAARTEIIVWFRKHEAPAMCALARALAGLYQRCIIFP